MGLFGNKDKNSLFYRVKFVRKLDNYWVLVDSKRYTESEFQKDVVEYNGKKYLFDKKIPSYIFKNEFTYYVDLEQDKFISFNEKESGFDKKAFDLLFNKEIVAQSIIAQNKSSTKKAQILIWIILGCVIALPIGYLIATIIYTNKIQEILIENNIDYPIIFNSIHVIKLLRFLI